MNYEETLFLFILNRDVYAFRWVSAKASWLTFSIKGAADIIGLLILQQR